MFVARSGPHRGLSNGILFDWRIGPGNVLSLHPAGKGCRQCEREPLPWARHEERAGRGVDAPALITSPPLVINSRRDCIAQCVNLALEHR